MAMDAAFQLYSTWLFPAHWEMGHLRLSHNNRGGFFEIDMKIWKHGLSFFYSASKLTKIELWHLSDQFRRFSNNKWRNVSFLSHRDNPILRFAFENSEDHVPQ